MTGQAGKGEISSPCANDSHPAGPDGPYWATSAGLTSTRPRGRGPTITRRYAPGYPRRVLATALKRGRAGLALESVAFPIHQPAPFVGGRLEQATAITRRNRTDSGRAGAGPAILAGSAGGRAAPSAGVSRGAGRRRCTHRTGTDIVGVVRPLPSTSFRRRTVNAALTPGAGVLLTGFNTRHPVGICSSAGTTRHGQGFQVPWEGDHGAATSLAQHVRHRRPRLGLEGAGRPFPDELAADAPEAAGVETPLDEAENEDAEAAPAADQPEHRGAPKVNVSVTFRITYFASPTPDYSGDRGCAHQPTIAAFLSVRRT